MVPGLYNVEDEPFDASTFSKSRGRLLEVGAACACFAEVVAEARRRRPTGQRQ